MTSSVANALPATEEIDRCISMRLRQRRLLLGVTQCDLAQALGVSFQQIQKYETGANRISSARLFKISGILDVPISYFYRRVRVATGSRVRVAEDKSKLLRAPDVLSLIRHYYLLEPQVRRSVAVMCRSLVPKKAGKNAVKNKNR